jgi:hypothetical protein
MSEEEIRNFSGQIISEIAGPDPAYQYVNAINNAIAPLLSGTLQVHVTTEVLMDNCLLFFLVYAF